MQVRTQGAVLGSTGWQGCGAGVSCVSGAAAIQRGSLIIAHTKSSPWAEQRRRLQGSLASQLLLQSRMTVRVDHKEQAWAEQTSSLCKA